jgi:LPS sulfotransferase NodH
MKSNFVIFAEPRTGSGVLTSVLNHQKDIFCLKEIFREKYFDQDGMKKYLKKLDPSNNIKKLFGDNYLEWNEQRNKKFKDFLNLLSKLSDKKVFGYKFFERHFESIPNKDVYLNFLKENNTKIIILERNNILLQYISLLTARSIKTYTTSTKTEESKKIYQLNPIEVNYNKYIKYNKNIKRQYKDKLEIVQNYNLTYIHLIYEDFTGEKFIECFESIFDCLDLKFEDFIDLRNNGNIGNHKKINIYKIKDKILNYEAFKQEAEKNNDIETLKFLKDK